MQRSGDNKESKDSIQQTLDLIDDENFTKCFAAIEKDDAERLRALIEHGADIMQAKRNGKLAVLVAAERDSWGCVEVIMDHLRPTLIYEGDGSLHSDHVARALPSKLGELFLYIAKTNQFQRLKLFEKYTSTRKKDLFFVKEFGDFFGHKFWQDSDNGNTALHWAVQNDNFVMIKMMLSSSHRSDYRKLFKVKNNEGETFLDLACRLKKISWIDKDLCGKDNRLSIAIKASKIVTLYDLLMLNVFMYSDCSSDSRQDKLLEYMLALPDSDKSVALTTALNQKTALGAYMAQSKQCERHRRIMQVELQRLAGTLEALPAQPVSLPPVSLEQSEQTEELKPIYTTPNIIQLFPRVPKRADENKKKPEKKDKKKSEKKQADEPQDTRPIRKMASE